MWSKICSDRVTTRAIMVYFNKPTVGPDNDIEEDTYREFEELVSSGDMSWAVGWVISLGKELEARKAEVRELKDKLRGVVSGRNCKNWGVLLFFVQRVSVIKPTSC